MDTIEVDLATLKRIIHAPFELRAHRLSRVIFEFSISPGIVAAFLANDMGGTGNVSGPCEPSPAIAALD